jgi:hypothetical protein
VWKTLIHWRYLLLACLVLVGAIFIIYQPTLFDQPPSIGPEPEVLRDNYQRIKGGMTEEQVKDILGPPDSTTAVDASSFWFWRDKQKNGYAVWFCGDTVCSRKFWLAGEAISPEWESLSR